MRKKIFTFISILLVCVLLQGNVRAAELPEGEPAGAEATATDAGNVETPGKYDEKKGIASIRLMYCADSGAKDVIKTGYAFIKPKVKLLKSKSLQNLVLSIIMLLNRSL